MKVAQTQDSTSKLFNYILEIHRSLNKLSFNIKTLMGASSILTRLQTQQKYTEWKIHFKESIGIINTITVNIHLYQSNYITFTMTSRYKVETLMIYTL